MAAFVACIPQNGDDAIPWRWDVWKVKTAKLARGVGHGKNHRVLLPLQAVLNAQLIEQPHHVGVGTEKDVQASLIPIAILVFPRGHLSETSWCWLCRVHDACE